jgi:hypothetical protein
VVVVRGGATVASWPLGTRGQPDLELIDELARLQLGARRVGYAIRLRNVVPELAALLDLVGLRDILSDGVRSRTTGEEP